ncbi:MAG: NAD-dependent epimerase/dehydratase family protein [Anaerolineae bacterium]|nr:NAD-dependent epimerase/dehydratase family protein [Anaerolineae bacterium]
MRALVTGATGFLGSHVARALVARGHVVRIWRRPTSNPRALAGLEFEDRAGDLFDVDALRRACAGCDWVFHTAAAAQYWRLPAREVYRVNVEGTRAVLEAARRADVARVVLTSTGAAVGVRRDGAPADERLPFNLPPRAFPYGHSKWLAEEAARAAAAGGLPVVIVNPSVVLGPGDLNRVSGDLVVRVARREVPMAAPGGVGVIDVRDVAAAHVAAAERGRPGERYLLNAHNTPTRDLIALIAAVAGVRPPRLTLPRWLVRPAAAVIDVARWLRVPMPMDANQLRLSARFLYFDAGKARRELGLVGRPLEETVRDTWAWYRQEGIV